MLYNFLLEIKHDCTFSKFSATHPKIEIYLWCDSQSDILEMRGEEKALKDAINDIEEELGEIVNIFTGQEHVQLVIKLCNCALFPLDNVFNRYNCLELPPIRYIGGKEKLNLIVTPEDAGLILEDIRREDPHANPKVLKLAPLKSETGPYPFYLPLDELKGDLTNKQLEALQIAYKQGYYELPRKVFLEELAEKMNIHRRTYEEHLRKAERKLMKHLVPPLLS